MYFSGILRSNCLNASPFCRIPCLTLLSGATDFAELNSSSNRRQFVFGSAGQFDVPLMRTDKSELPSYSVHSRGVTSM